MIEQVYFDEFKQLKSRNFPQLNFIQKKYSTN